VFVIVQLQELESKRRSMQQQVQEEKAFYESLEKQFAQKKAADDKKMQMEKDFLRFQSQHLESFLKSAKQK